MKLPPTNIYLFTINLIIIAGAMATAVASVFLVRTSQRSSIILLWTKMSIYCHNFIAISHELCAESIRTSTFSCLLELARTHKHKFL